MCDFNCDSNQRLRDGVFICHLSPSVPGATRQCRGIKADFRAAGKADCDSRTESGYFRRHYPGEPFKD